MGFTRLLFESRAQRVATFLREKKIHQTLHVLEVKGCDFIIASQWATWPPLDGFLKTLFSSVSQPKKAEREREMFQSKIVSHLRRNKTLANFFVSHLKDSTSSSSTARALNERFRFFASKSSGNNSFSGWNSFYAFRSLRKV